jgi:glycerol kinase
VGRPSEHDLTLPGHSFAVEAHPFDSQDSKSHITKSRAATCSFTMKRTIGKVTTKNMDGDKLVIFLLHYPNARSTAEEGNYFIGTMCLIYHFESSNKHIDSSMFKG